MAGDTWGEDRKYVLNELKRLENMDSNIVEMRERMARLEVKSSIWGAISGAVTSGIAMAGLFIKNALGK